jgi:anaerobic selenocysteine-containing dehydrogenase
VRRLHDAKHPWLKRARPEPVLEIPVALGKSLGVQSGDWVKVSSARGEIEVKALVTPRMKPIQANGREVTVVWMPYNWGYQGLSTGRASITSRSTRWIRRRHAGDQGLPGQRREAPRPEARFTGPEAEHELFRVAGADQDHADRHQQLHRLPCLSVACKQWNDRDGERRRSRTRSASRTPPR